MTIARQPSLYIPHGGGPCFFMEDPDAVWAGMAAFLRSIPAGLPETPKAILVVSGHWETAGIDFTSSAKPDLVFDYYGFPPHTYQLRYDAPGARLSHPREEHLLPFMVAAGASDAPGQRIYNEPVMKTMLSGFRFP